MNSVSLQLCWLGKRARHELAESFKAASHQVGYVGVVSMLDDAA
jgi:hypothetical protein